MVFSQSILMVVGTRPEAIKLAPVADALLAAGMAPALVLTGQHMRLDLAGLGLGGFFNHSLHCRGLPDPHEYAGKVATALSPLLAREPELIIVQGDTSSALGGALAGFRAEIPVAHVEAGLRSFDPAMPWPEEDNRQAIDAGAALLFAPTEDSAANLRAEQVGGEIHVTGNTAIDALRRIIGSVPPLLRTRPGGLPRLVVTCHRRENWGVAFLPVALALIELARSPWLRIEVVVHPNPAQASTMREMLSGVPRIRLLPPMDHGAMVASMRGAALILSDSGGVQEEAPALGVPLLVLREKTERPEGIRSGNMLLVGTDTRTIVETSQRLLADEAALAAMAVPALPYGDGHAAPRIAAAIGAFLEARSGASVERLIA